MACERLWIRRTWKQETRTEKEQLQVYCTAQARQQWTLIAVKLKFIYNLAFWRKKKNSQERNILIWSAIHSHFWNCKEITDCLDAQCNVKWWWTDKLYNFSGNSYTTVQNSINLNAMRQCHARIVCGRCAVLVARRARLFSAWDGSGFRLRETVSSFNIFARNHFLVINVIALQLAGRRVATAAEWVTDRRKHYKMATDCHA